MNRLFDRSSISVKPLSERKNKLDIERDMIDPESFLPVLDAAAEESVRRAAAEVRASRAKGAPVRAAAWISAVTVAMVATSAMTGAAGLASKSSRPWRTASLPAGTLGGCEVRRSLNGVLNA